MKEVSGTRLDPITFEIIKNRLTLVTEEMGIALKRVSGSTTTTEGNDFEAALYAPSGDIAAVGRGITLHVAPASAACKHVVTRYKKEEIEEGDTFVLNDPYVAAYHQSDIYFVTPIHFDRRLVGWAANFTHIVDIGGIDPGGFCPSAREVYQEGLRIPSAKLVKRGEIDTDLFEIITNNSREPGLAALDLKSQLAANNVANMRLKDLIKRYGVDDYLTALDSMIHNSEILLRSRLRELPDGEWTSRVYIDLADETLKVELRLEKEGDKLHFDFTGTSPQVPVGMNCTIHGTKGNVFTAIAHMLAYDIPWNEAILKPVTVTAPEGTLVNCRSPAPVSMATIGAAGPIIYTAMIALSQMMRPSRFYAESTAIWGGSHQTVRVGIRLPNKQTFISADTDHMSSGAGAVYGRDGIDTGGRFLNLKATIPNIEHYESRYPVMYLFRRQVRDSGGAGKYRGGVGAENSWILLGEPGTSARLVLSSNGMDVPECLGIFGGFPGNTAEAAIVRGSNVMELLGSGGVPTSVAEIGGKVERPKAQSTHDLSYGDVFYRRWSGGGGYGDPIDREARLVAEDVRAGLVSKETALAIYGVVLDNGGPVNEEATRQKRNEIRRLRVGRLPKGRRSYDSKNQETNPSAIAISDQLIAARHDGRIEVVCKNCATILSVGEEDWKRSDIMYDESIRNINPLITSSRDLLAREFVCPSCGTLLSTEIARKDDPILHDKIRYK